MGGSTMKQRYDSYKPSGIDWIGDIPSHWKVVPIKQICRSEKYAIKTGPFGSQLKGEDLKETGDIRVYNQRNVIDNNFSEVSSFVTSEKAKDLDSFYTLPNDLLVTSRGTIGKSAILPKSVEMGILHPCLIALRIDYRKANLKWVQRWINESDAFRIEIASKSNATTIDVIYTETLKNIRLALPPLAEQEAIAAWLDTRCGEIDAAISKVDREIELIDELKQSEISRVVTSGLNPDAPLRSSGIDWIGDIPSHWKIVRLAHIFNAKAGGDAKPELYSDTKDAQHPFPVFTNSLLEKQVYAYTSSPTFQSGSITVTGRGEIGHAFLRNTDFDAIIRLLVLTPKIGLCCKYFTYFIDGVMEFFSDSAAVSQLSAQQINKELLIIPPLSEQQAIADYLDKKCAEIDGLKAKLTKKRETLTELRHSIISEVVTGKRKVI